MSREHTFETSLVWSGGRGGVLQGSDLPELEVAAPPAFGGPGRTWTPEHLFVASTEACTLMTFLAIADFSKLPVTGFSSQAKGVVEKVEGEGYQFTVIEITLRVGVGKQEDIARAERIVDKAKRACLVSKSLRTPVEVKAEAYVGAE